MISGAGVARAGVAAAELGPSAGAGAVAASCTVAAVGLSLALCVGTADGAATVAGAGVARATAVGAVDGAATVSGAGAAVLERSSLVWRRYVVSSFRQELSPPILSAEQAVVDFDFGGQLISGESVLLPPTLLCSTTWGADDAAAARIVGDATVNPSPSTGATDGAIAQLVGGMRGGVRYKLQCSVVTTRGQTLSRSAYLNCNT